MISFQLTLSSSLQIYDMTENTNTPLISVINNLFKREKFTARINCALCEGNKLNLGKTIFENNIHNGSKVILVVENIIPIKDNKICNLNNPELVFEKCYYFLVNVVKISPNIFDKEGNCLDDWETGIKNGPPGYLKEYYPPLGWIGIGLKVFNLYDNQNNTWLGNSNKKGEWYIAYHGIKTIQSLNGILNDGFKKGIYQACKNNKNINYLTNKEYPLCGEGVYFISNFSETLKYIKTFKYLDDFYRIILMCRINPYKVRIADIGNNLESWIVNENYIYERNRIKDEDEVRICKILMKLGR